MNILWSLLPVLVFFLALYYLDSFKLVSKNLLVLLFLSGIVISFWAYPINNLMTYMPFSNAVNFRLIYPLIEEILKFLPILWIYKKGKSGFVIDSMIYGFAVGTGFGLSENIYYFLEGGVTDVAHNVVRGFGTAMMHAASCSISSMLLIYFNDTKKLDLSKSVLLAVIPAFLLHSFYNSFFLPPLIQTISILVIFVAAVYLIFSENEKSVHKWIEDEFDSEILLIQELNSGNLKDTQTGKYINEIKSRFSPFIVFDMLCLIGLSLELSIQAKVILMLQNSEIKLPFDAELDSKIKEYFALQKNIGITGMSALSPVLKISRKELWKISKLQNV